MAIPGRCELIGALLLLAGAVLSARAAWRLAATVRARLSCGSPYREGWIADRALGLLLALPLFPLGTALVFFGLAQGAFQPTPAVETARVGQVTARHGRWARTVVELAPDPLYPEQRVLRGEIEGARWAITGDFINWPPGMRLLGLRPAHRVRALVGSADSTGLSSGTSRPVVPIDAPPRAAAALLRCARYIPFLTVTQGTSDWFEPADRLILVLHATREGYVGDVAAERGPARIP